jgi:hypothetical protein
MPFAAYRLKGLGLDSRLKGASFKKYITSLCLYYINYGLRRLSPPRGAGWEPGSIAFRAKKSPRPSDDYEYSCVRGSIGAVTVRLFNPSTWSHNNARSLPLVLHYFQAILWLAGGDRVRFWGRRTRTWGIGDPNSLSTILRHYLTLLTSACEVQLRQQFTSLDSGNYGTI